jgi:signal transduction histidine kinase
VAEGALTRVGAAAALAAAAVAAELAAPAGAPPLAVLDALVAVAFALGAAAVMPVSRSVAALAFAVAAAWVLGTLAGLGGIPSYVAGVALLLHRAPLTLLILEYPGRRLRGTVARVLALAALVAPLVPGEGGPWATAAIAGLVAVAALTRAARAAPALRPPQAAAALLGAAIAVSAVLGAAQLGSATELLVAYVIVLLGTAITLLIPLAGGRWQAAAASGLVVELGTGPPGAPATGRLAEVLHDPGLELRLRLADGSWTDEAGRPAPEPGARDSGRRSITRRVLDDGTEVALIHDPSVVPDRAVAESAVAVAATAIDNARRDREVHTRIAELRRLRRGLLEAADEERRQLEVELQSGPLRAVEELDDRLRDLPPDQAAVARSELALAHRELVDIAHGLYPQALIEHGLTGALSDMAARSPIPVTVESTLPDAALPPPLALTAYYVASEALANVAKHASATLARLELSTSAGELLLRVVDDGVGGADPTGHGLRGLRDRVQTVDGRLHVHSPHGAGTVIEARIPIHETC